MSFFIASSPHTHSRRSTPDLMKWVALCAIPGLAAQT
ncbi:electron transport complex subunit RsxD, partial [Vibrio parahaemolyticus]|nr:electron transport complex subunit RsxD [Vibrio parahaemolyticus]